MEVLVIKNISKNMFSVIYFNGKVYFYLLTLGIIIKYQIKAKKIFNHRCGSTMVTGGSLESIQLMKADTLVKTAGLSHLYVHEYSPYRVSLTINGEPGA